MKTFEGIFEDLLKISQGKHLFSFIFLVCWGGKWSSAHTLGPILKRKTPKCAKLNYLQFDYKIINIWSTSSINFFKKTKNKGAVGGNPRRPPPPQPPKNFERSILLASQFPTRISKNFDSSYYNARDLAIFITSTVNIFSCKKWSISKCHPLNY